ncbi:hypothetical protein [Candidatus Magnetaquicoccus inordinatus]|uniref:hypothetical protein n=1 Tax=Candidatus Magnetaquicoccus inordinatus TaxID=2496818 RepID=UPI00102ADF7B|nr:hypothetical protein [Candidatus Magnetaquicoccus inordinatus]
MLQLIPYGLAAVVGGLLGKKYLPQLIDAQQKQGGWIPFVNASLPPIQILAESLIQEQPVVLATEEIPLDNRYGTTMLVSEHEFTRTATVGLSVGREQTLTANMKSILWPVLESVVQEELKKNLRVEFGSQITRRVKIVFSAEPGHLVRYRLVWRQDSRQGVYDIRIGNEQLAVPYMVTFGLFHAVESMEGVEHERG